MKIWLSKFEGVSAAATDPIKLCGTSASSWSSTPMLTSPGRLSAVEDRRGCSRLDKIERRGVLCESVTKGDDAMVKPCLASSLHKQKVVVQEQRDR